MRAQFAIKYEYLSYVNSYSAAGTMADGKYRVIDLDKKADQLSAQGGKGRTSGHTTHGVSGKSQIGSFGFDDDPNIYAAASRNLKNSVQFLKSDAEPSAKAAAVKQSVASLFAQIDAHPGGFKGFINDRTARQQALGVISATALIDTDNHDYDGVPWFPEKPLPAQNSPRNRDQLHLTEFAAVHRPAFIRNNIDHDHCLVEYMVHDGRCQRPECTHPAAVVCSTCDPAVGASLLCGDCDRAVHNTAWCHRRRAFSIPPDCRYGHPACLAGGPRCDGCLSEVALVPLSSNDFLAGRQLDSVFRHVLTMPVHVPQRCDTCSGGLWWAPARVSVDGSMVDNPAVGEVVHVVGDNGMVVDAQRRRYAACRRCSISGADTMQPIGVMVEPVAAQHPSLMMASSTLAVSTGALELAAELQYAENGGVGDAGIAAVLSHINSANESPNGPRPGCDLRGHTKQLGTVLLEYQFFKSAARAHVDPLAAKCLACLSTGVLGVHIDLCRKLMRYKAAKGMCTSYSSNLLFETAATATEVEQRLGGRMAAGAQGKKEALNTCGDSPGAKKWSAHHGNKGAAQSSLHVHGLMAGVCPHQLLLAGMAATKPESLPHFASVAYTVTQGAVAAISSDIACMTGPLIEKYGQAFLEDLPSLVTGQPATAAKEAKWANAQPPVPLRVPIRMAGLHANLHEAACQIENGGWQMEDLGRQLGEQGEELFSRKYQMGRIIKVRSEARFHDTLTAGMWKGNNSLSDGMAASLVRKLTHAERRIHVLHARFQAALQAARAVGVADLPAGDVPPDHAVIRAHKKVVLEKYHGRARRIGQGSRAVAVGTAERPASLQRSTVTKMAKAVSYMALLNRAGIIATPTQLVEQEDGSVVLVRVPGMPHTLSLAVLTNPGEHSWLHDPRNKGLIPAAARGAGFTAAVNHCYAELHKLLASVLSEARGAGVTFDTVGGPVGYVTQAAMDALAKEQIDTVDAAVGKKAEMLARMPSSTSSKQRARIHRVVARCDDEITKALAALGGLQGLSPAAQAEVDLFRPLHAADLKGPADLPLVGENGASAAATRLVMAAGTLLNEHSEAKWLRAGLQGVAERNAEAAAAAGAAAAAAVQAGQVHWPQLPPGHRSVDVAGLLPAGTGLPGTYEGLRDAVDRLVAEDTAAQSPAPQLRAEQLVQIGYRYDVPTDAGTTTSMRYGYASAFNLEKRRRQALHAEATRLSRLVGGPSDHAQQQRFKEAALQDFRRGRSILEKAAGAAGEGPDVAAAQALEQLTQEEAGAAAEQEALRAVIDAADADAMLEDSDDDEDELSDEESDGGGDAVFAPDDSMEEDE